MTEINATLTQRGQITVPAEVRRLLGVKPRDTLAFVIEDGQVRLVPARYTIETAFGSVGPATATEEIDEQIRDAKTERADRMMGKHKPE